MIDKDKFRQLWHEIIEQAVILDPESEHYGMNYHEAIAKGLIIPTIEDTCSPRLADYLTRQGEPKVFKVYDTNTREID